MSIFLNSLDSCPFCGGRPKVCQVSSIWIQCSECESKSGFLSMPNHSDSFIDEYNNLQVKLIRLWNKRILNQNKLKLID